jgi:mRNA interferase MazF
MSIKRGNVVLVLYPDSNLRTAKRRPALVVQSDSVRTELSQVIVAMITSNMARAGHPSRVPVLDSSSEAKAMGLRMDSIVMTDNLATVMETEIDGTIGQMPKLDAVDAAMRYTLALT